MGVKGWGLIGGSAISCGIRLVRGTATDRSRHGGGIAFYTRSNLYSQVQVS